MSGRRAVIGLCMLCALAISAFAAPNAVAQKAHECAKAEINVQFKDAHCKEKSATSPGFSHVLVTKKTAITLTNATTGAEKSTAKLKSVQSGVTLEVQATTVSGTGEMENKEEGATTWAEGSATIVYEGVTVTAPSGKGCKVAGEKITTNKLAGTTKGLTNQLKFTPASGETFAEFTVEGCSIAALNHVYTAKGSVTGDTEGTTTVTKHEGVTLVKSLLLSGQVAGIDGKITIKSAATGNGLALT